MKAKTHCRVISGAATALYVTILSTPAAVIQKADNVTDLNLPDSWSGNVVPGSGDIASWDSTVPSDNTASLVANTSYSGISITSLGGELEPRHPREISRILIPAINNQPLENHE